MIREIKELHINEGSFSVGVDFMKDVEYCMKFPNCKFCPLSSKCEKEVEKDKESDKK